MMVRPIFPIMTSNSKCVCLRWNDKEQISQLAVIGQKCLCPHSATCCVLNYQICARLTVSWVIYLDNQDKIKAVYMV